MASLPSDNKTQPATTPDGAEDTKLLPVKDNKNEVEQADDNHVVLEMVTERARPLIYKISEIPPFSLLLLFAMQVSFSTGFRIYESFFSVIFFVNIMV